MGSNDSRKHVNDSTATQNQTDQKAGKGAYRLPILTSIWNWAIRKIELDVKGEIFYTPKDFQNLLHGTSRTLGIPSHTIQGMLSLAHQSWQRCFKKLAKKPRLKGNRNRLNSIPFPDPIGRPVDNRIKAPGLGRVRYHKQDIPEGKIKCGRIVKRASTAYLRRFAFVILICRRFTRCSRNVWGCTNQRWGRCSHLLKFVLARLQNGRRTFHCLAAMWVFYFPLYTW